MGEGGCPFTSLFSLDVGWLVAQGGKAAERQDIAASPQPCAHPISAPQHSLIFLFCASVFLYFVFLRVLYL